jgi:hypothetical protein
VRPGEARHGRGGSSNLPSHINKRFEMPDRKFLSKIHILKKEKKIPDEDYRGLLMTLFKVTSSKDLSNHQAILFLRKLDSIGNDPYTPSKEQVWKIQNLWHSVYRGNEEIRHLRVFLWKHFKVSDIRFLDKDKAHQAIEALKSMQKRRTIDDAQKTFSN